MKRILFLILAAVLSLLLAACSASVGETAEKTGPSEIITEEAGHAAADDANTDAPSDGEPDTPEHGTSDGGEEQNGGILVAYFSWADNAVLEGDVDAVTSPSVVPPGNVQQLAGWVQEATGADLFSIRVTEPYPSDWDECLARANDERGDDARPELAENVENMEDYEVVFLGYPKLYPLFRGCMRCIV